MSLKNSNDTIGNRTRDLPVCSLVHSLHLLAPWSRVLLEKPTGSAASQEIPRILEPEGSSPYSQVPATCPYPEPTPSSPHNPPHFLKIHLNIIFQSAAKTYLRISAKYFLQYEELFP